jgi:hypothetical protein
MYRRSTRSAELSALPPPVVAAIDRHAGQHQLRLDAVRAWVTHSENPPSESFFGKLFGARANSADPDAWHDTYVLLHPTHLVVATAGEKRPTSVLSLPLALASMVRGSGLALAADIPGANDGVTVTGFPGEHGQTGSCFVGLGPDAAGRECAAALEAAITAAKNPR